MTILAKPDQTLEEHLQEVIEVLRSLRECYSFIPEICRTSDFWQILFLSALLHDFGKSAEGFQKVLKSVQMNVPREQITPWNYRHEFLSAGIAKSLKNGGLDDRIILAIITHHKDMKYLKKYMFTMNRASARKRFSEKKEEISEKTKKDLVTLFNRLILANQDILGNNITIEYDEFISVEDPSDKIREFAKKSRIGFDEIEWKQLIFLKGLLTAADHLASAGYTKVPYKAPLNKIFNYKEFWRHQIAIGKVNGSCCLLAPTGTGKTESAFIWANNNCDKNRGTRIFYVLPFTASINAMYRRILGKLNDKSGDIFVSMLHHRSHYFLHKYHSEDEKYLGNINSGVARDLTRKVYAPVKVMTPFQILKSLFSVKGYEQRLTEITRGLIIFDEIHLYDVNLIGFILEMIKFLAEKFEVRFLFMSATFPDHLIGLLRSIIPDLELVFASDELKGVLTRHQIFIHQTTMENQFNRIKQEIKDGKKVLVVCNTVKNAQIAYRELGKNVSPEKKALIHGRFILRDREEQERNAADKFLLVGTQAIEVSLNISFDVIYTELAPIDALVQRFGRVNRKGVIPPLEKVSISPKPVHIVTEGSKYDSLIYSREILQKTLNTIKDYNCQVLDEKKVSSLVNEVYKDGYGEEEEKELNKIRQSARRLFNGIIPLEDGGEEFDNLISGIQGIPLCYLNDYLETVQNNPVESQKFFLSLSRGQYFKLRKENRIQKINGVNFIDTRYSPEFGLQS